MTIDAGSLSPLEVIAAVNAMQGRETGPSPLGYVDEHGAPARVTWAMSGQVSENVIASQSRLTGDVAREQAEEVDVAAIRVEAEQSGVHTSVSAAPLVREDFVNLVSGRGKWDSYEFELAPQALRSVRNIVVAAIQRNLRAQAKALAPRRARKRRSDREEI